jgi:succinyl-diaminopimelate desuccinylase
LGAARARFGVISIIMARQIETDPLPILEALIRCPSVTPDEAGALGYLEKLFAERGFDCERLAFASPGTPEVQNLFVRIGRSKPHLCFAGHIDVVPPGRSEGWSHPPFAAEQAGGYIYGRGASDMKGSVAAFAAAALDVFGSEEEPAGTLSLLLTADEEGPAVNGTVKVLEWMSANGHVPDHCIVGEPTSEQLLGDTIKNGRRGSLSFTISIDGVQGHVAYPHKADNPIPKLVRLLDRLNSTRPDGGNDTGGRLDNGNEQFEPSTLAITSVDVGNPAANVIPARATAKLNIRFNTEHTPESLIAFVVGQCEAVERELGGNFTVVDSLGAEAFVTEPGPFLGVVLDSIAEETGVSAKLSTTGGTSDARFVKNYCPVLEFGPSNATIHQVDERIAVEEIRQLARIYRSIIEKYFQDETS